MRLVIERDRLAPAPRRPAGGVCLRVREDGTGHHALGRDAVAPAVEEGEEGEAGEGAEGAEGHGGGHRGGHGRGGAVTNVSSEGVRALTKGDVVRIDMNVLSLYPLVLVFIRQLLTCLRTYLLRRAIHAACLRSQFFGAATFLLPYLHALQADTYFISRSVCNEK